MHALLSWKHPCSLDGAYSASRWSNATIHDGIWSIATSFSWWLGACIWRSSSLDLVGFFSFFLHLFSLLTLNFITTLAKIKCLVSLCLYQFWFLFFYCYFFFILFLICFFNFINQNFILFRFCIQFYPYFFFFSWFILFFNLAPHYFLSFSFYIKFDPHYFDCYLFCFFILDY